MNGNDGEQRPDSRRRLRRAQRLRLRRDFLRVWNEGRHAADRTLVVHACPNRLPYSRLGVQVSRRVGSAVVRNRWKRWIREAFRIQQHELPRGLDVVVRPRKGARGEYHAIAKSLRRLLRRLAPALEKTNHRTGSGRPRSSDPGTA